MAFHFKDFETNIVDFSFFLPPLCPIFLVFYICCLDNFKYSSFWYRGPFDFPCRLNCRYIFFLKINKHNLEQKQNGFVVSRGRNSVSPKTATTSEMLKYPCLQQTDLCVREVSSRIYVSVCYPKGIKGKSNNLSYHYKAYANTAPWTKTFSRL
jgi:hypothetical protein